MKAKAKKKTVAAKSVKKRESKPKARCASKVKIKYDVGFSNILFIRGSGAGLSWDRGVELQNVSPDEWVWEVSGPFQDCEFKVLINDQCFEEGENHHIAKGQCMEYTPNFLK